MAIINITVKDKIATSDGTVYVCGNSDYVINFTFDSEWDMLSVKTARFCYADGYTDVVFTGSLCEVPIMARISYFTVGVFSGDLHTTTPARVVCKKSILCDNGTPIEPEPDVYAQIIELLNQSGGGGSGFTYKIGHGLKIENGNTIIVDTAKIVERDNTLPITSAAVHTTVGNIEILLQTI